ncbi:UvrD-helicase domain-containing protein [Piscinibacter sakaiensis]|uniref:UvrD-helicase domain-containing protein n=1 Tax=Piscinibacter sakaiensis TaxID=1547922 RepID=UPI003AAA2ADA
MNPVPESKEDDIVDKHVDDEIASCLSLDSPRSFFLFAGAGSGKTGSLVTALQFVRKHLGKDLRARGQRVAVITYTNAASEEIQRRIEFDSLTDVSTIHSFAWSMIEGLTRDIKLWLVDKLERDLVELGEKEAKGRKGTAASAERLARIESKTRRLRNLPNVRKFTYSATGENRGRDALNHTEVLQIAGDLLIRKPTMQSILTGRYPILLIDESQDTMRAVIDALFHVQAQHSEHFLLGLLGDMMQRIYFEGKEDLGRELPDDWAKPAKSMNHRCPKRVIELINKIREPVDGQVQRPRSDAMQGTARLFILASSTLDKPAAERAVAASMAGVTGDNGWTAPAEIKTLTLEHRMAAKRMGFDEAFAPLYSISSWRTGLLDGKLSIVQFFTDQLLPLLRTQRARDRFGVARLAKKYSPLLSPEALRAAPDKQRHLRDVNAAVAALEEVWTAEGDPTIGRLLSEVLRSGLLEPPEVLVAAAAAAAVPPAAEGDPDDDEEPPSERDLAVRAFLAAPFSQVATMSAYLVGRDRFGTHQGVKGLEFDRVMVIMDDSEAGGFSFKYEDLFGGKDSTERRVQSTRRLFYVTTSRARKSLALVAYAERPQAVRDFVLQEGWFGASEIIAD